MKQNKAILGLLVMMLVVHAPMALADEDNTVTKTTNYSEGVKAADKKDFSAAVKLLEREVAENDRNADAFNMLGFSHRNLGNLELAVSYYLKALAINPDHKGAHEYLGETYLKQDNLAKAKEHLARLDKICWLPCEQFDDLKAAIKRYENGKRS